MTNTMELVRSSSHVAAILKEEGDTKDIILCFTQSSNYENSDIFSEHFKPKVLENIEVYDTLVIPKDTNTLYLLDKLFHDYHTRTARIIEDELNFNIYLKSKTNISVLTLGVKAVPDFLTYIQDKLLK